MNSINIDPTVKTPKVNFDAGTGILEIEGRSIPENSTEFYKPIFEWLDNYITSPNSKTVFNFKLEYFNTSSSKCILDLFRKLEKLHNNIMWRCFPRLRLLAHCTPLRTLTRKFQAICF